MEALGIRMPIVTRLKITCRARDNLAASKTSMPATPAVMSIFSGYLERNDV